MRNIQISLKSLSIPPILGTLNVHFRERPLSHLLDVFFPRFGLSRAFVYAHLTTFSGHASPALLALAILTHLSLPAVLLTVPVIMLLLWGPESSLASPKIFSCDFRKATRLAGEYTLYLILLTLISTLVSDGWGWTLKTWGTGFEKYIGVR